MKHTVFTKLLLTGIVMTVAGCSSRVDYHGKLPEPEKIKELKIGVNTQEDVLRLIGSPTTVSAFDPRVWLYIHRTTESKSFLEPTVLEQKQVIVTFDDKGLLGSVKSQTDEQDVVPAKSTTPSSGLEPSWAQQIFGNYGRFAKKGKPD